MLSQRRQFFQNLASPDFKTRKFFEKRLSLLLDRRQNTKKLMKNVGTWKNSVLLVGKPVSRKVSHARRTTHHDLEKKKVEKKGARLARSRRNRDSMIRKSWISEREGLQDFTGMAFFNRRSRGILNCSTRMNRNFD